MPDTSVDISQQPTTEEEVDYEQYPGFYINPNGTLKNSGFPSFNTMPDIALLDCESSASMLPNLYSNKNSGFPSFTDLPDLSTLLVLTPPFPEMLPCIVTDINLQFPSFSNLPDLSTLLVQVPPFPKMLPGIVNGVCSNFPNTRGEEPEFGACSYCSVEEIEIPRTVMYIADYVFYNSRLRSVKINKHCVYFAHTFPTGCRITFYNEEEG